MVPTLVENSKKYFCTCSVKVFITQYMYLLYGEKLPYYGSHCSKYFLPSTHPFAGSKTTVVKGREVV